MTYNAADEEDLRVEEVYVKLEDGGAGWQAETSTSGCCSGGGDGAAGDDGGCLWSLWWWAKLVLVVLFVAVLGAVFFKWIGPFFMDKVNFCSDLHKKNVPFSLVDSRSSLDECRVLCVFPAVVTFIYS